MATRWIVYTWVECAIEDWRRGLRTWLDLRKDLYVRYGIPPSYELHATKFVNGRGNPSTNEAWNRQKNKRGPVVEEALSAIGQCGYFRVGTVYRVAQRKGTYVEEQGQVYRALVDQLEVRLTRNGELGILFMDGDGTSPMYRRVHRELKLADRRIIEDPLFQGSHHSQWIQMADLAAYTAYQGLARIPGKEFAWNWYMQHLAGCDVNGGPIKV